MRSISIAVTGLRRAWLLPLLLLAGACQPEEEQTAADPAVPVEVLAVSPEDLDETVVLTGILAAYRTVDVVSEVAGTVEQIHCDVGQSVADAAKLATLDKQVQRQRLRQADAARMSARAQLGVARADYLRDSTLIANGDIAPAAFELSRMNWQGAQAALSSAAASRELAARDLRETDLRAPFGGYVARRMVEIGTYLVPGQAVFRLVDIDSLRLVLGIAQHRIARVHAGMQVTLVAEAFPQRSFIGRVRSVSPEADEMTRTFALEVILPNPPDHPLRAGMVVRASLILESFSGVIAVARECVLRQGEREFVYVLAGDRALQRRVQTDCMIGGRKIIAAGLQPGDRLVHVGMENLRDSSRVVVAAPTASAGDAS